MAGGQDHLGGVVLCTTGTTHRETGFNLRYPAVEMILSSVVQDALTDVLDHFRQAVCTNMGMGVYQNVLRGAEGHQLVQHLADVSALGRAGIELSVTERPGAAFSVTIVRIRVYDAFQGQLGHVHLAAFHILSALQHNGLQSQLEQFEGCEHPGGAGTDYQHR